MSILRWKFETINDERDSSIQGIRETIPLINVMLRHVIMAII